MELDPATFILDTSAYSAFNRGDQRLRPWFVSEHTIKVPLIVIGELRAGFAAGSRTAENEQLLERFLDSANVELLSLTLETTKRFTELFKQIRTNRTAISTNDLWIASLALEHDIPILTLDNDFQRIKRIRVIKL